MPSSKARRRVSIPLPVSPVPVWGATAVVSWPRSSREPSASWGAIARRPRRRKRRRRTPRVPVQSVRRRRQVRCAPISVGFTTTSRTAGSSVAVGTPCRVPARRAPRPETARTRPSPIACGSSTSSAPGSGSRPLRSAGPSRMACAARSLPAVADAAGGHCPCVPCAVRGSPQRRQRRCTMWHARCTSPCRPPWGVPCRGPVCLSRDSPGWPRQGGLLDAALTGAIATAPELRLIEHPRRLQCPRVLRQAGRSERGDDLRQRRVAGEGGGG
jgi:hypothetical protein